MIQSIIMLVFNLFSWWYTQGWVLLAHNMKQRLVRTSQVFSVPILVRTLFSPWRRIISYPGSSIGEHFRAMADNAVSRIVGFFVRLFVLLSAAVILLFVLLLAAIELVGWPLLPILVIALVLKGIS